jgi:hypothetical protein
MERPVGQVGVGVKNLHYFSSSPSIIRPNLEKENPMRTIYVDKNISLSQQRERGEIRKAVPDKQERCLYPFNRH